MIDYGNTDGNITIYKGEAAKKQNKTRHKLCHEAGKQQG